MLGLAAFTAWPTAGGSVGAAKPVWDTNSNVAGKVKVKVYSPKGELRQPCILLHLLRGDG
jgi:hypothetical protein